MPAPPAAELASARAPLARALADLASAVGPVAIATARLRADAARDRLSGLEGAARLKRAADIRAAGAARRERNRERGLTSSGKPRKPKRTPEQQQAARVKAQAKHWGKKAAALPADEDGV